MRTGDPHELNKGLGSKFCHCSRLRQEGSSVRKEGSRVKQEIPEEGRRAHRPKCCRNNNEDEHNSLNNTNNTNHQASSQKFREIVENSHHAFSRGYQEVTKAIVC